jgi:acetolactate synthase-1/2/3 large subunit
MATANGASVADAVARFVRARGPKRVFGLSGGHIQPIWDGLARCGVRIVDVRHEGAAVHMATAHALLTREVGIATVTAGPGVTNCVTAISNAHLERAPVLVIGGCPPTPQDNTDALQGTPSVEIVRPVTRLARTLREPEQVLRELDYALTCATGLMGPPGPVYVEIPVNVLRQPLPTAAALPEFFDPRDPPLVYPDPDSISRAAELLAAARRPLVVSGRGAAGAGSALCALLEASGALYLDTRESRGVVPQDLPTAVGTVRSVAVLEADLIVTVGCRLDSIGSTAVPNVTLVRIARHDAELRDHRRGAVEILADPEIALEALAAALRGRSSMLDAAWAQALCRNHRERWAKYLDNLDAAPSGTDGFMHPNRIFAALRRELGPGAISVVEGGEMLNLAQLGLPTSSYLDAGASGCLGVGVPFANAAALAFPERKVVAVCEDSALGRHAIELDTTARHGCRIVVVVANKGKPKTEAVGQYLNFGTRPMSGEIEHADFAAVARAFGLHGERVVDPRDLVGALQRAFARCPGLVDVCVTRDEVSS